MVTWKKLGVLATGVTTAVVLGAYLVFFLTLGPERMPPMGVFAMIAAISLSLFLCGKVIADLAALIKDGSG